MISTSLPRRLRVVALCWPIAAAAPGCRGAAPSEGDRVARRAGDLIAARSTLEITDSVPGDVVLAGRDIVFTGVAGGDYLGAGGEQAVAGRIRGDVRAAGGEIRLAAEVGRNATVAGGRVDLGEEAVIGGNAYVAGGELRLDGAVRGFLKVAGEEVVLDGMFGGDVDVEAGRLHVGPRARIAGDLRYRVPREDVTIDPGAEITGRRIALPPRERPDVLAYLRLLSALAFLVTGGVAVALFPGTARAAAETLGRRPGAAAAFGLLWIIAVPIAALLAAMTVVGLPLALIATVLYLVSLYLGRSVPALWLGRLVLRGRAGPGRGGIVLGFLVGGAILLLAGAIPLAGAIVTILATILGVGALVLALRRRSR